MSKKSKWKRFLPLFLFLIGFLVAIYPLISQYYYRINADEVIQTYIRSVEAMEQPEIERKLTLAKAYNRTLDPSRLADPFSKEEEEGRVEYARMLEINEKIGYVEIPRIGEEIPIYAGTAEAVLRKGAGHLEGTSLPVGGESTHSVITAHRGLPEAKLFTDLDRMEKGDIFYLHILDRILAYQVDRILTVEPSDFDPVLVVEGEDYSTLLTCTPLTINTHRLLVRGRRIDYTAPIEEVDIKTRVRSDHYKFYLMISMMVILILIYLILRTVRSMKKGAGSEGNEPSKGEGKDED